ncbi:hypothetical protein Pan241w_21140 [Gimesia alba]|uniref:Uncharacterized protein n=1 Tax=Gimesia alba TaxID=2527973 RepID=A0A517RDV0_9PLAN|nr:hypothetical protein Pan241w_21140 [Gimesia alba]
MYSGQGYCVVGTHFDFSGAERAYCQYDSRAVIRLIYIKDYFREFEFRLKNGIP